VFVSARTGAGLAGVFTALEPVLPRPAVPVHALVPYTEGGLVSRVHRTGEVLHEEHVSEGTLLTARVDAALAADLAPYAVAAAG
jgi:GTP-binding protein HflX